MNIANNSNCLYPLHSPYPGGVLNIQINRLYGEDLEVIQVGKKSPFICSSEFKAVNLISPIPLNSKERNIKIVFNNKTIKTIPLIDKDYRESKITIIDNNMVNPSQEILPRIRMEASIIKAAKNINTITSNPVLLMTMPTLGIESSEFGVRRFINGTPRNRHTGLDIAAPEGTNVYAPLDGLILLSEEFFYRGNIVYIDHGNGLISSYSHLQESFVKKNKKVKTGDLIGKVGKTGRVTGSHLHWEVSILGTTIDPKLFLKKIN